MKFPAPACFAALAFIVLPSAVSEDILPVRVAEISQAGIELVVPTTEGYAYFPLTHSRLGDLPRQPVDVVPLIGDGLEQRLAIPLENADTLFARVLEQPIYFDTEHELDIIIEAFLGAAEFEADTTIEVNEIRTPDGTFSLTSSDQGENLAVRIDGGLSLLVDTYDPNRLLLAVTFETITEMDYDGNFIASHTPASILEDGGPDIPISFEVQIQFTHYDAATGYLSMLMPSGALIEGAIEDFGQSFSTH